MGKIRRSFTAEKKSTIIEFAERYGNKAAEKEFNVAESNIRFWRKNKAIIEAMPKYLRSLRFSKARWPELEEDLKEIITDATKQKEKIRPCDIRNWALDLAQKKYGITESQFRARPTWVFSFCRRHGIKIGREKNSLQSKEARKILAMYQENHDHSYYKLILERPKDSKLQDTKENGDNIVEPSRRIHVHIPIKSDLSDEILETQITISDFAQQSALYYFDYKNE